LGEFPSLLHPVVWIGKIISLLEKFAPKRGLRVQFIYGVGTVISTTALFAFLTYLLLNYLREINVVAYILVAAFLLKSTFSVRELHLAAFKIKTLLEKNNLGKTRFEMRALVSRDTSKLDEPLLVSATLESVSESTCDSFVAPLFYFLLLGVPGAIAYRVVNTFDAMIGYREKYEYLGKFAAKLDDVLNFIPARLSGLLIVVAAFLCKRDSRNAWRVMLRDKNKTESPNAGWPMGAAAGALRVKLEKAGHYNLGNVNNPLSPKLISSGVRLVEMAMLLWVLFCLIMKVVRFVFVS
jgi:adenosylcobinamide-phosphate synthase